jgi:CheY-like chemotaxis protein
MKTLIPTIYYLEDDLEDQEILDYVMIILKVKAKVQHFLDGEKGLKKLFASKEGNQTPAMVLIDINMPVLDGIKVVSKLKEDEVLKDIPVVVLSTSIQDKSVFQNLNVEVIKKPSGDVNRFLDDMRRVFTPFIAPPELAN